MSDDFDFRIEADKLLLAMRFLADLDLDGILRTVEIAHTVGWVIDPTKYRDALSRGDMDAVRDLAAALREPVRIWTERIAPKVPVPS